MASILHASMIINEQEDTTPPLLLGSTGEVSPASVVSVASVVSIASLASVLVLIDTIIYRTQVNSYTSSYRFT